MSIARLMQMARAGVQREGWDLANASYDGVSFSVGGQDTSPYGVCFNNDGTKMYTVGLQSDTVHQYSLSTAFDISTASYDNTSFSVTLQEGAPRAVAFKNDGTKMYIVGTTADSVFQYSLSTAFDVGTASYDSVSFSVAAQTLTPYSVDFNNTGTKMFVISAAADASVYQYSLSTAFNVGTASYDSVSFSVAAQDTSPRDVEFSADGTKMFTVGSGPDAVFQYSLSTAFDVGTASYDSVSFSVPQLVNPQGLTFNSNGTKMYVIGNTGDTIYQYSTA